jgi:hypothetical protein
MRWVTRRSIVGVRELEQQLTDGCGVDLAHRDSVTPRISPISARSVLGSGTGPTTNFSRSDSWLMAVDSMARRRLVSRARPRSDVLMSASVSMSETSSPFPPRTQLVRRHHRGEGDLVDDLVELVDAGPEVGGDLRVGGGPFLPGRSNRSMASIRPNIP